MSLIKDDQPAWDAFVEAVLAIPEGPLEDDSEVYFNLDSIYEDALQALKDSMNAKDSDAAQEPLEAFGIKWLHLGQS